MEQFLLYELGYQLPSTGCEEYAKYKQHQRYHLPPTIDRRNSVMRSVT